MSITSYKAWLWGGAIAVATLLPFSHSPAQAADASRVPVKTLAYRSDIDQMATEEVRWGRRYYGPRGFYYGPRYYSGYRWGYYPPYSRYYAPRYYPPYPGGYYVTPGYYGGRYYGGGVRIGGLGIFWR